MTYVSTTGGAKLVFRGKEALGVPEQTLVLPLLEIAQDRLAADPEGSRLDSDGSWPAARQLWLNLHKMTPQSKGATVYFTTTWSELCRRCGCKVGGFALKVKGFKRPTWRPSELRFSCRARRSIRPPRSRPCLAAQA
ncbi:MAG: hypothetical protein IH627_13095 [Rubrivivax sp.]|nr:hypothetical protein [Rubrivivax sp.]